MSIPRLRMVAGPNGSGKTTLINTLASLCPLGFCLNPDAVQLELQDTRQLDLAAWKINASEQTVRTFFAQHPLGPAAAGHIRSLQNNLLTVQSPDRLGYFAAVLADFIRRTWISAGVSFTFETVMSSPDKVDLLRDARSRGYRVYLYFVCTESPAINRARVAVRVKQGGHSVPEDKIDQRYQRSLALLPEAIRQSHRAYLFDNSSEDQQLIAEYEDAKLILAAPALPSWFVRSALNSV